MELKGRENNFFFAPNESITHPDEGMQLMKQNVFWNMKKLDKENLCICHERGTMKNILRPDGNQTHGSHIPLGALTTKPRGIRSELGHIF